MTRREEIRRNGHGYNVGMRAADWITWDGCYVNGYREPRFPVPAHAYLTLISPHSVEMVTGIIKTFYPESRAYGDPYIAYDCECVFFISNYPD